MVRFQKIISAICLLFAASLLVVSLAGCKGKGDYTNVSTKQSSQGATNSEVGIDMSDSDDGADTQADNTTSTDVSDPATEEDPDDSTESTVIIGQDVVIDMGEELF